MERSWVRSTRASSLSPWLFSQQGRKKLGILLSLLFLCLGCGCEHPPEPEPEPDPDATAPSSTVITNSFPSTSQPASGRSQEGPEPLPALPHPSKASFTCCQGRLGEGKH